MPLVHPSSGQLGNILFPGRIPQPDISKYSLEADGDDSVPVPPPPKGGNVQGKPRDFLPYAPSWAKHPDYDRVGAPHPVLAPRFHPSTQCHSIITLVHAASGEMPCSAVQACLLRVAHVHKSTAANLHWR